MATLEHEVTTHGATTELGVRLSREQAETLERAAQATGQSLAEFAATALLDAANTALTAPAVPPAQAPDADWHAQNDRRIDLIFRERDHGLSDSERAELGQLQAELERRADRRRTLDFDALAEWEQAGAQAAQSERLAILAP